MLTVKRVQRYTEKGRYRDGHVRGLCLVVDNNKSKHWEFRYQLNGRARYMGLGSASVFSLKAARERARAARRLRDDGIDPLDARRAEQRAAAHTSTRLGAAAEVAHGRAAERNYRRRDRGISSARSCILIKMRGMRTLTRRRGTAWPTGNSFAGMDAHHQLSALTSATIATAACSLPPCVPPWVVSP
jgi:hypothetical protein